MPVATAKRAIVVGVTTTFVNNAATVNATIPGAALPGDFLVMFTAHGFGTTVPLSGWPTLGKADGANTNITNFFRVARAGDAGSTVTVNFAGGFYGTVYIVAIRGGSLSAHAITQSSGGSPLTLNPAFPVLVGDLVLIFGQARATNTTITSDVGTILASRAADSNTGSALYVYTGVGAPVVPVLTSSVSPSGFCGAVVAIRP